MSVDRFLVPRLIGSRFEGHAIPLEMLEDLAVLPELITKVAKTEFLREHPGRTRSPRGFTEGIEFKLTGIEEGSARPVIGLFLAASTLFPLENQAYLEKARDSVVNAIAAAENNQSVTNLLPEEALSYFDRLGRSLRPGEAIEFGRCNGEPARLTPETRLRLLLSSPQVNEYTEEVALRGRVSEADVADMTFELHLADGRKIKASLPPQHQDTIHQALGGYRSGQRILLQGIGRFDRNRRLTGVESVEQVSMLDPLDIGARLDELRLLKDGWLEGEGKAPTDDFLKAVADIFARHFPEELSLPYLYPTPEGGVRAEWSFGCQEITLDIGPDVRHGQWHRLDFETDATEERRLELDQSVEWQWLSQELRRFGGAA